MNESKPDTSQNLTTREQYEADQFVVDFVQNGRFREVMREENFSKGVPVSYMDDDDHSVLVQEFPDGEKVRAVVALDSTL